MHPLDGASRTQLLKEQLGLGLCNITKCCTEVCPEEIHITDNAIIPLKERVVDEFYDPITMLFRKIRGAEAVVAAGFATRDLASSRNQSATRAKGAQ